MSEEINRDALVKKLTPELEHAYSSPESGELMYGVYTKHLGEFNPTIYSVYAGLVGDTILGIHKTSELVKLFQSDIGIDSDTAKKIFADLIEFFSPVMQREESEAKIAAIEAEAEAETLAAAKKESMGTLAEKLKTHEPSTPAEIAEKHETIAPIRTMQTDARMHGYGAELQKEQQVAEESVVKATPQEELRKPST